MPMILKDGELIHVRFARDEHPDPDDFPMHAHGHYEILFFLSGDITYVVEGSTYRPRPRDIMIFNAAETHKVVVNSDKPYERIVVQMEKELLTLVDPEGRLLAPFYKRKLGQLNAFCPEDFPDGYWELCLRRISVSEGDKLKILSYLMPFLNELCSAFECARRGNDADSLELQVVSYVNAHISEHFTPEDVAREFLISRTALYDIFRKATGSGLHEYTNAKRLLSARELLHSGEKPTEVYLKCGFQDYSTFFRAYKKHFGISPREDHRQQRIYYRVL